MGLGFRIKICGVTRDQDLAMIAAAGADAIGLNFYPPSSRYAKPEVADQLAEHCPSTLTKVGVFVNAAESQLQDFAERFQLDWLQLHGDEPASLVAAVSEKYKVIRAFRVGEQGLDPVLAELDQIATAGRLPHALLLDAAHGKEYGGTGKTLDWSHLSTELARLPAELDWLLAGGLKPENVEAAVAATGPGAVDTASGVEASPGVKSAERVAAFVMAANKGWPDRSSLG